MRRHDSSGSASSDRSEDSSISFLSGTSSFLSEQSSVCEEVEKPENSKSTRSAKGSFTSEGHHSEQVVVLNLPSTSSAKEKPTIESEKNSPNSEPMEQESPLVHFDLPAKDH